MGSLSCSYSLFSLLVFVFSYNRAFAIRYGVSKISGNYYCGSFLDNYAITWGDDHISTFNQGRTVQLSLDKSTGGSGFGSKLAYSSGSVRFRIKVPGGNSTGVVTAFYLASHGDDNDELDFEFLGGANNEEWPITIQTNIVVNGVGGREQIIRLWFDPSADYHSYKILWNPYQIVFFVDKTPIRVYKNKRNIGIDYPTKPMHIEANLWDGDHWGTGEIDWNSAPFKASFRGFNIDGCSLSTFNSNNPQLCSSSKLWWNRDKYRELDHDQEMAYERVKQNYIIYDYCTPDPDAYTPPPECPE